MHSSLTFFSDACFSFAKLHYTLALLQWKITGSVDKRTIQTIGSWSSTPPLNILLDAGLDSDKMDFCKIILTVSAQKKIKTNIVVHIRMQLCSSCLNPDGTFQQDKCWDLSHYILTPDQEVQLLRADTFILIILGLILKKYLYH